MHLRSSVRNIFVTRSMLSALEAKRSMAVICLTISESTNSSLLPDLDKLVANYVTSEYQLFEEHFFKRHSYSFQNTIRSADASNALRRLEEDAARFPVISHHLSELKALLRDPFSNNSLLIQSGECNRLACFYSLNYRRCSCGRPMIPVEEISP